MRLITIAGFRKMYSREQSFILGLSEKINFPCSGDKAKILIKSLKFDQVLVC